jgi:hypothetical protein
MGDGNLVFDKMLVVLKVIMTLKPKHEYVKSLMCFVGTLLYWKQYRAFLPFWDMFVRQPNLFDAEQGESSFSVLSRASISDTMKATLSHLSELFTLTTPYLEANRKFQGYMEELSAEQDTATKRSGIIVKPDDPDVVMIGTWLDKVHNELRHNCYSPYLGPMAFLSQRFAQRDHSLDPTTDHRVYIRQLRKTSRLTEQGIVNARRLCVVDWAKKSVEIRHHWPELPDETSQLMDVLVRDPRDDDFKQNDEGHAVNASNRAPIAAANARVAVSKQNGMSLAAPKSMDEVPLSKRSAERSKRQESAKRSKKAQGDEKNIPRKSTTSSEDDEEEAGNQQDSVSGPLREQVRISKQSTKASGERDFSNQMATDPKVEERFEILVQEWARENPNKQLTAKQWTDIGSQARLDVDNASCTGKRRVKTRQGEFARAALDAAVIEACESDDDDEGDGAAE